MSLQPQAGLLAFSYVLGVSSLLSPCGFALLPGYASYWMGSKNSTEYALKGGTLSGLGFISTFLVLGLLVSTITNLFLRYIFWIEISAASFVALLGVLMLIQVRLPTFAKPPKIIWRKDLVGMYGFGITYGLAASGCSAPIFFSVVALAIRAGALLGAGILLLYGVGMGSAFVVTAVLVAQGRVKAVKKISRITPIFHRVSAVALIIAGLYTVWIDLQGVAF